MNNEEAVQWLLANLSKAECLLNAPARWFFDLKSLPPELQSLVNQDAGHVGLILMQTPEDKWKIAK